VTGAVTGRSSATSRFGRGEAGAIGGQVSTPPRALYRRRWVDGRRRRPRGRAWFRATIRPSRAARALDRGSRRRRRVLLRRDRPVYAMASERHALSAPQPVALAPRPVGRRSAHAPRGADLGAGGAARCRRRRTLRRPDADAKPGADSDLDLVVGGGRF